MSRRTRRSSARNALPWLHALCLALFVVALRSTLRASPAAPPTPTTANRTATSSNSSRAAPSAPRVAAPAPAPITHTSTQLKVADGALQALSTTLTPLTPVNLTRCNCSRVADALYKIVKLFGVHTLCDLPAASHASWMLPIVNRLSFETPSFQYVAVDPNEPALQNVSSTFRDVVDVQTVASVRAQHLSRCELLFYWPACGAPQGDVGVSLHARQLLAIGKQAGCALAVLAQSADARNGHTLSFRGGKWTLLAPRSGAQPPPPRASAPFVMNDFVKGAIPIGNGASRESLYMTLYSLRAMPRDALL